MTSPEILKPIYNSRWEEMRKQARDFHVAHPQVWRMFVKYAHQMADKGYQNYSAIAVMERIRWETDLGNDGITKFKICNNHTSFYGRWYMKAYPQMEGFFRVRTQKSHEAPANGRNEPIPLNLNGEEKL